MAKRTRLECVPLTPDRWDDLASLFGPRGACGGCWCMVWRLKRSDFEKQKGDGNRDALRKLVDAGPPPGILAYVNDEPIGWCAVAPRADYPALARSRVLKPLDDAQVWSVTCLFIRKDHRRAGISVALLRSAIDFVRDQGGTIVEGYPIEPRKDEVPAVFAWTGLASAFLRAGFREAGRHAAGRPIMRRVIGRRRRDRRR